MRARLRLELTDHDGRVVVSRSALNSVMQGGAGLVASLFAGAGSPISHMGVGTNDAPESEAFSTTALSNDAAGGGQPLTGDTEAPIPPEAFSSEVDTARRVVRMRVRGTLPDDAAVGVVREAGLLAKGGDAPVLYNRVTFAPVTKGADHELTLFWEIEFPYGDLQWLL
jgi:hypothetical protein